LSQPLRLERWKPYLKGMNTHCEHGASQALTSEAVLEAMHKAEARCLAEGARWTPPRQRVFELLLKQGAPIKAYDLMAAYGDGAAAKPATVYRALEFLETHQLAHRIASLNAYVACDHRAQDHTAAFMICECCGSTEEFEPVLDRSALRAASAQGFAIKAVALEVRGLCQACSSEG
jgi:Fur family zinc uptake transcriptional regulator